MAVNWTEVALGAAIVVAGTAASPGIPDLELVGIAVIAKGAGVW